MPVTNQFPPKVSYDLTAVIASAGTTSGAVDLHGCALLGLIMPSAFTGTAVTFTGSDTAGGTYVTLYTSGANLSVTVAASKWVILSPSNFAGVRFIKIVSNGAEGAERTIKLVTRPV